MYVSECMCVRERKRETERDRTRERKRGRERETERERGRKREVSSSKCKSSAQTINKQQDYREPLRARLEAPSGQTVSRQCLSKPGRARLGRAWFPPADQTTAALTTRAAVGPGGARRARGCACAGEGAGPVSRTGGGSVLFKY